MTIVEISTVRGVSGVFAKVAFSGSTIVSDTKFAWSSSNGSSIT